MVSNVLEIAGLAAITVGCFLFSLPIGLIVLGLSLVLLGAATDRRPGGEP